ncbi:MAG: AMP-binding protein [Candidatus Cloacimonetes bacterium]|nr:AMP-binding protein [Candidatus Cloacimonadota bacterium]
MLNLKNHTLQKVLEHSVRNYKNNPCLSLVDGEPITYGELKEKVDTLKKFLNKQGVMKGDRVAILSDNNPNWGVVYFALTSMGVIAVPILPGFHENEVHHIIRHARCKAIFVSKGLYHKIEELSFDPLKTKILIDDLSLIPPKTTQDKLKQVVLDGSKEFAKIKELALRITGKISTEVQEDDVAALIYTSGTTGHSKGVMLTHKNIVSNALATINHVQTVTENDRLVSILPLSHTYECTIGFIIPFVCGASIYYLNKPPTARLLLPAMEKIKPTMILTVPIIIEKIFKKKIQPVFKHSSFIKILYKIPFFRRIFHKMAGKKLLASFGGKLHFYGIGGALLSAEVERFLRDAKFPYAIGYGLTETSPLIAGSNAGNTRFRAVGPVLKGVKVKIDKKTTKSKKGEILVKGDNVMKGYFKDPKRTEDVFTDDGWFKTGDLGMLKHGYLYIKGRLKNVIVGPSGENIFPEEIEAMLNEYDYVLEALVYKQNGKLLARVYLDYDEIDKQFYSKKLTDLQMKKQIKKILREIRRDINENLSSFSRINKIIEQAEPFKKTPTHKIKRYLYVK